MSAKIIPFPGVYQHPYTIREALRQVEEAITEPYIVLSIFDASRINAGILYCLIRTSAGQFYSIVFNDRAGERQVDKCGGRPARFSYRQSDYRIVTWREAFPEDDPEKMSKVDREVFSGPDDGKNAEFADYMPKNANSGDKKNV